MSSSNQGRGPSRNLILAAPVGVYLVLYLAPDHGWARAGGVGGGMFLFILFGPALLGAGFRAADAAARRSAAKKKRKPDEKK